MTTLSTPTASVTFPFGTADTPWVFSLTGTNPDGTAYSNSVVSDAPTAAGPSDLQVGATVVLVVTKNGISSQPSAPTVIQGAPVTLTVPDASQPAVIAS